MSGGRGGAFFTIKSVGYMICWVTWPPEHMSRIRKHCMPFENMGKVHMRPSLCSVWFLHIRRSIYTFVGYLVRYKEMVENLDRTDKLTAGKKGYPGMDDEEDDGKHRAKRGTIMRKCQEVLEETEMPRALCG